jgi:flagellar hook protein FlgE
MASLFSALTVAVGGLAAQSSSLGNISDNLSNSQTTGFKAIGTDFESLVTQSDATNNDPGGVRATPSYQNDVQGNLIQSSTATSLAISGQGFFSVEAATANADGSTTFNGSPLYTRQGDFTLDKNGFLVNSSGYYLTGWNVAGDGTVDKSVVNPIQVSALLNNPVASTSATFDANLPSSAANNFTSSASTIQLYDALGNTHDMNFVWTKQSSNNWDVTVTVKGAGGPSGSGSKDLTETIPFVFNSSTNIGSLASITSGGSVSGSGGKGIGNYTVVDNSHAAENKAQVSFNLNFGGFGAGTTQSLTLNFGDYNLPDGLTQFADTDVTVSSFSQNGLPQGSFTNLSIDKNGLVSLNYNNGSLKTIAQVPIVQFYAQDQLQRVSGGVYEATLASGTARYSPAGISGAGTIAANSLESSNVDIAGQFTNMIEAQQIYSANAKTITTIDNMLNTIINTVQ